MNKTHFSASLEEAQTAHSAELAQAAERRVQEMKEAEGGWKAKVGEMEEAMKRLKGDLAVCALSGHGFNA